MTTKRASTAPAISGIDLLGGAGATIRRALGVLLLLVAGMCSGLAPAAPGPQELIVSTTEEVLARLRTERDGLDHKPKRIRDMVRQILLPHVEATRTARLVLGKHWRTATPEQRSRFTDEFNQLLLNTYSTALAENVDTALEHQITYLPFKPDGDTDEATVRSEFRRATAPPIPVLYRLRRADGAWKIYDVLVDGISLVVTYRSTFASEISRGGLEQLLDRLAKHNQGYGERQGLQKQSVSRSP